MKHWKMVVLFLIPLMFGCVTDPDGTIDPGTTAKLNGVFILNEGNFQKANGSVAFLSNADKKLQSNIFKNINNEDIGEQVQSLATHDTLAYIVVTGSNKIEVISLNSWKRVATISFPAGSSPHTMAIVDQSRAYVTSLYGHSVSIVDLNGNSIIGTIPVGQYPEDIKIVNQKAYVANSGFGWSNTVSVIDISSNSVTKTILVGDNPRELFVNYNLDVHVLCTGNYGDWNDPNDDTDGGVYIINSQNDIVSDSLVIPGHPSRLSYDGERSGYFMNNGYVQSYSTEMHTVVNDTLIPGFYYGMEVDPVEKKIYMLDAKDFQQNGTLHIYNNEGQLEEQYDVGIIPGNLSFIYE